MNDTEKKELPPIALTPVTSSNVASIGHDPLTNRFAVQFKNGGLYHYHGVDQRLADEIRTAKSIGSAVRKELVLSGIRFERMDRK